MRDLTRGTAAALLCLAAVLSVDTPLARAAEKTYEIRLTRPDKVGDKFKVAAEGGVIRETAMVVDGERKEQPATGDGIKLDGSVEVLAVTPKGKATKLSVTVDRCIRVSGPEEGELLPAGARLTAEADGKDTKFTRQDGGELPPEAHDLLELLIQLSADDARGTDDELFGTTEKQPVGATWQMNAARAAKDFAAEDITVDPADITGSVKLEGTDQTDGIDRIKLSGRMNATNMRPDPKKNDWLPEGFKMESGTLDFKFTVALPADPSKDGVVDESMSARHRMAYAGKVPGGQTVRSEVTMQRAAQMKRTPVK